MGRSRAPTYSLFDGLGRVEQAVGLRKSASGGVFRRVGRSSCSTSGHGHAGLVRSTLQVCVSAESVVLTQRVQCFGLKRLHRPSLRQMWLIASCARHSWRSAQRRNVLTLTGTLCGGHFPMYMSSLLLCVCRYD